LLSEGPQLGYQLKTAFDETTGGVWALNVGQVYTTLDRLHRDGLVEIDEGTGQKRYSLTAAGHAQLGGWWAAVPAEDPPPRDELLLKILFAIAQGRDHALAVITRHRTALTRLLQQRRRADGNVRDGDVAVALVADSLNVRAEADLRWLDLCEARVLRMHDDDAADEAAPERTRR
jgi:DNA-binding PadR family transcriptional regulator